MDAIWPRCMDVLRSKVNEHTMSTWIEPIVCEDVSEGKITLSVPNNFFVAWLKDNHLKLIRESILEVTGNDYELYFKSRDDFARRTAQDGLSGAGNLMLQATSPSVISDEFALKHNLNPRYTFDSFVVGSYNRFAHAAALSVSENLGGNYNPFFIFGGVGLGKTHLLSSIGYTVLSRDRNKRISFATSEEFTNEMINALRFDRMVDFRNKYRNVDLLMIDDIQFLAGKERTQEEFFHTFNSIYEARKQIVITSDRFPNEISDMEHRLRSRFSWGLVADMGTPDLETKVAILKRKAFEDSLELPDEVAYFLAEQVDSNIRDLVGYLIRVIAMSTLQGIPLTKELAQLALREILHRHAKAITIDDIISHAAKAFNIKPADIKSKKKHKQFSLPRQVAMYLARELTELSYPEIGAAMGGKDHSTVIYGTRKVEKKMEQDHSLRNMVEGLKKNLRE
ncbi:MAG: chromosomal replication initiator protein DnaA [Desulfomonile tiedjei]|nr:chromosomal replication initiator protein DnaA [Desulfomonile tiedjei]